MGNFSRDRLVKELRAALAKAHLHVDIELYAGHSLELEQQQLHMHKVLMTP
jgi:hypothetical protein